MSENYRYTVGISESCKYATVIEIRKRRLGKKKERKKESSTSVQSGYKIHSVLVQYTQMYSTRFDYLVLHFVSTFSFFFLTQKQTCAYILCNLTNRLIICLCIQFVILLLLIIKKKKKTRRKTFRERKRNLSSKRSLMRRACAQKVAQKMENKLEKKCKKRGEAISKIAGCGFIYVPRFRL